jgi:hypothetical protein
MYLTEERGEEGRVKQWKGEERGVKRSRGEERRGEMKGRDEMTVPLSVILS